MHIQKLNKGKIVSSAVVGVDQPMKAPSSVVPRSRFLGDTSVPLPEFLRDICKFWGTNQFHLIFACKIENSFSEISVHFYLLLSSMSIVLAQEGVQITVK